jgi:hypothetical protein
VPTLFDSRIVIRVAPLPVSRTPGARATILIALKIAMLCHIRMWGAARNGGPWWTDSEGMLKQAMAARGSP